MLGEFDIWSKRNFFTKKSWKPYFVETEYKKWTKDLLQIEYSFESKYFIGHKTFSDYWNLGEFNNMLQNSIKNNTIFRSVNYKKFWSSICSISLFWKFYLLVVLDQYLLNTNDICL